MYFLIKTTTWFQGHGNDFNTIPLRVVWICSPSLKNSCTATVVGVRRLNQARPSWGRPVTSATMASKTSICNPQTSEWVSVRFKENCKVVSRWNPSRSWKNLVQPLAWKIAKTSAFHLIYRMFGGSYWARIPMFACLHIYVATRQITDSDNGG